MVKVTKVELFTNNNRGVPEDLTRTLQCPSGNIFVEWSVYELDLMCAMIKVNSIDAEGYFFTGRQHALHFTTCFRQNQYRIS